MRAQWIIFIFLFLLSFKLLAAAVVDQEVVHTLQNNDEAQVIVLLKDQALSTNTTKIIGVDQHKAMIRKVEKEVLSTLDIKTSPRDATYDFELTRQFATINGFTGNITQDGLDTLLNSNKVAKILPVKPIKLLLDGSVPQINAHKVWNLSAVGYNITGIGETICVIDTGINYSHPAIDGCTNASFLAGTCSRVLGGYDYGNSDADPMDYNSHGTHVAGIAASNDSTYRGVAPGAKMVALKVFTDAGSGNTANVISALDWCINNRSKYNISVITMSLGVTDGSGNEIIYTSACDTADNSGVAAAASKAAAYGIFVDASAGNSGSTTGVVAPSCGINVTSVGSVTKADAISGYNSGPILDILAPGSSITSSVLAGFGSKSGTSMAAPHIAGAAALLLQYGRLVYNINLTPTQIETKFKISGVQINDTRNGIFFSRIDMLAAVQPFINYTLTSVANASSQSSTTALINISSDANITAALLEWSYSNGTIRNISMTQQNTTVFFLTITNLVTGTDTYKVYANDTINTFGTSSTRTLTMDTAVPLVTISTPTNGSNVSTGTQAFNVTILEANSGVVLFSFNNASGVAFNVTPSNNSGNWNTALDLTRLQEGVHSMTVIANDTFGNRNTTQFVQFTLDRTPPAVTINTLVASRNFTLASSNQTFNATVRDSSVGVQTVLLSFDNASGTNFNVTAVNQSGYWVASYNVSALAEGTNTATFIANDTLNNRNNTESVSFTVDFTAPTVSFASPSSGSTFTFLSSNQTFSVTVRDALLPIQNVILSFNNASGTDFNVTAANQSGSWVVSYNVSLLADGSHTLTAFATDLVGNINNTQALSFTVDINNPIVTLNSPATYLNSSTASLTFNCSTQDNSALANVTLYGNWSSGWHANQTTTISGTSAQTTFSKTLLDGTYIWNCLAYDTGSNLAFASSNFTLSVDTVAPVISAVSSGTPTSTATTITWTTNENANSTVNYGTALSLGSTSSSTTGKTAQSISISSLTASTLYYFNVTSCDKAGNCLTNGTYNFSTTAASGSGSSSSSSGGGGGGGGGGSGGGSIGSTAATPGTTPASTETPSSSGGGTGATTAAQSTAPVTFSQTVDFSKDKTGTLTIDNNQIAFTKVELDANSNQSVTFTITYYPEKPSEVPVLQNTYQYLQIAAALAPEDVKRVVITFKIPRTWLTQNNYQQDSVTLHTLKNNQWVALATSLTAEDDTSLYFQAKLDRLTYFAITGSSTPEKSTLGKLLSPESGSKVVIILGVIILIAILGAIYFILHRDEEPDL